MDATGISCFATPGVEDVDIIRQKVKLHLASGGREDRIPHANQLWMLVGFELFRELSSLAPCLEVFPQATIRGLGIGYLHKSQPGAVAEQLKMVASQTGWDVGNCGYPRLEEICWGAPHDQLDAYMSAWVASLEESDRFCFGVPPDDVIWVPKPATAPMQPMTSRQTTQAVERRIPANPMTTQVVLCPACGQKEFKRWPWGWDGHAAHACKGLLSTTPETRKAEFRNRFAEFFLR